MAARSSLLSDAASSDGVDAARRALAEHVDVSVIGVASEQGAPVVLPKAGS